MKKIIFGFLISLKIIGQSSWSQLQNFPTSPRASASIFIINDTVYAGTGRDSTYGANIYTKDFYKYNPSTNNWTPIADIPGERCMSTSFTIGNKGYVALGIGVPVASSQLLEYNPTTNIWTQKANFPGNPRYAAFSFVANGKAYIGGGRNSTSFNDLWEYNPILDSWTQKSSFPNVRHCAVAFSINNKGYMGLGADIGWYKDFYEYDPLLDTWTQKANFPDSARYIGTGFSYNNKGYAGLGMIYTSSGSYVQSDFWEYDPILNNWSFFNNIPGVSRYHCVAASSNSKVYILGGADQNIQFLSDFYSFPNQISTGTKLNCMNDFFSVYTNDNEIIIINKTNHEVMFQLCDIFGKIIYNHKLIGEKNKIKLENSGANLYTYRIITAELETINGKLIITN